MRRPHISTKTGRRYLAPDVRSMLVDESLSRVAEQEFRDNDETDVLFAVESLLEDVATIAVGRKLHNSPPAKHR
jgi:hypothetical protein